jgi:transposase
MKKFLIGIDVSKQKLDVCVINQSGVKEEIIIGNQPSLINAYLKKVLKENGLCQSDLLICAEYTGLYIYPLCCACHESGIDLWLENPTQIKYRSGLKRGKNDKLDARKIALYAMRFQDEAKLFSMPDKTLATLKQLIKERDMYIIDKGKYQGQLTDQKLFMDKEDYKRKSKRLKGFINQLDEAISQTEEDIRKLIDSEPELSKQCKLLRSVEGIGERTAVKMIVETNAFKDFKDPRKFCCHAGVAPFSYTSGSSQRSRSKVSHRADKSIKALLHMGALIAATRMKGELHGYYIRKVAEGKNKMSVLNAIRAKLVYRMFAVIRNDRMYQNNYQNALA